MAADMKAAIAEAALKLLQEKQETVGRTPKKEDFESVQVCFIKQILGPWPRALEKAGLKQPPVISSREKTQAKRARMKEKRKHQIAKMEVDGNGNVILKIQNPVFELPSYTITNMREPQLFVLESIHDKKRQYCILCCYINDEITRVYLDRNRLTKGGYLLGKLSAAGITWTIKTSTKAVHLFTQLITELINNDDRKIFLPEDIGWQVLDSGEFKYVEEGEPTWKKIIEWAK